MAQKSGASNTKKKQGYWKGVNNEFKKIVWPTKEELVKYTITVIVFSLISAGLIWILDFVFQGLLGLLMG